MIIQVNGLVLEVQEGDRIDVGHVINGPPETLIYHKRGLMHLAEYEWVNDTREYGHWVNAMSKEATAQAVLKAPL